MGTTFLVPSNWDIEKISRQYPFTNLPTKEKSAEYLLAFCGNLQAVQMRQWKKAKKNNGFTPLCSKYMCKIHHEYSQYMDYLVQAGIMETDSFFIEGIKCRYYKFTEPYRGQQLKEIEVKQHVLRQKLKRWHNEIKKKHKDELRGYNHIVKWLLAHKLQIDGDAAREWIKQYYIREEGRIRKNTKPEICAEELKKLVESCERMKYAVKRIESNSYDISNCKLGKNSKRLYTVLTGMKSELRNFIKIDGKIPVCSDLKNCQPYLLLLLLFSEFWQSKHVKTDRLQLCKVAPDIYSSIDREGILNCITLVKSAENQPQQGISLDEFRSMVAGGKMYEFLFSELPKMASTEYLSRYGKAGLLSSKESIKTVMLWIMNCDSSDTNKLNSLFYEPYRNFKKLFPKVVMLLEKIKEGNHSRFAWIMQRVESHLMLRLTCKKISTIIPDAPLFTIHDSIVITEGNEELVQDVLRDVLIKKIGIAPTVDVKKWQPENAYEKFEEQNNYIRIDDIEEEE